MGYSSQNEGISFVSQRDFLSDLQWYLSARSETFLISCFAKEVGSSPETVRKAISELQMHGIVERNRLGYFVTSNHEKVLEYRDSYLAAVEQRYFEAKQKVKETVLEINQGQF